MKKPYQIYCDRGNGPDLDGCWGSEDARFSSRREAAASMRSLHENYPDCAWLVKDERSGTEIARIGEPAMELEA